MQRSIDFYFKNYKNEHNNNNNKKKALQSSEILVAGKGCKRTRLSAAAACQAEPLSREEQSVQEKVGRPDHAREDGDRGCLLGLSFLVTDSLKSLQRDELVAIIIEHRGKVVHKVSTALDYLITDGVVGARRFVESQGHAFRIIGEEQFFALLARRPNDRSCGGEEAEVQLPENGAVAIEVQVDPLDLLPHTAQAERADPLTEFDDEDIDASLLELDLDEIMSPSSSSSAQRQLGKAQPLAGRTFLVMNTLTSLTRDECIERITRAGGRVSDRIQCGLDYIVADRAAVRRLAVASECGIEVLCEADVVEFMRAHGAADR